MPISKEGYPRLSVLQAGFLTLPEHYFCDDQIDKNVRIMVPSMSFLIRHPSGMKFVFDLGMRRVPETYSENIRSHIQKRLPIQTEPDVGQSLRKGGLSPADIDAVILSHVHYDHIGTPSDFNNARFIVGYGTRSLLENGMAYHSAANFEQDLLPPERTLELPAPPRTLLKHESVDDSAYPPTEQLESLLPSVNSQWKPRHGFDNTLDLFGDGSIYIIDSPGHILGHLNLLVRISPSQWVYLAGDACHHRRILDGQAGMATWCENGQHVCIHIDRKIAMKTLEKIRKVKEKGLDGASVEVVLAHDHEWFRANQARIWPSSF